jgi:hypothetical protein
VPIPERTLFVATTLTFPDKRLTTLILPSLAKVGKIEDTAEYFIISPMWSNWRSAGLIERTEFKIKAETMLDKITTAYHLQLRFKHPPERVRILWQSWWV